MSRQARGSRVGDDLVEAFEEMAAFLRGEVEAETYDLPDDVLTSVPHQEHPPESGLVDEEFERRSTR